MRTVLLVFCVLLTMSFALEAKKKVKLPPSQQTAVSKQHRADMKKIVKSRTVHGKHKQKVN